MALLTSSVGRRRLDEELTCKGLRNGTKWSAVLRAKTTWAKLEEYRKLAWRPFDGFRMDATWTSLTQQPVVFNKDAFAAEIEGDLLGGRRLESMLREMIDDVPLPGVVGADVYGKQGGVRAADICIFGTDKVNGLIAQKLDGFVRELSAVAKAKKTEADKLQQDLEKEIKEVNEFLAVLEKRQTEGWITGGALSDLEEKVKEKFLEVQRQVLAFGASRYDSLMFQCLADAWKQVRDGAALKAFTDGWKEKLAQTRSVLDDLVTRVKDNQSSDSGIEEILNDLRLSSADALTRVLRPELHTDTLKLWDEITETYRQKNTHIVDHIKLIQAGVLPAWRTRLKALHDRGKLLHEPGAFTHIVDLANYEAMPREGEKRAPRENQLSFGDRLDSLYELVAKESFAKNLLERENIAVTLTAADKEFLTRQSFCRLEVHRKNNGEIHRKDDLIAKNTGEIEPPKEHKHFHAPAGITLPDFPTDVENDRLEVRAFRAELSIPLPALKILNSGAAAAGSIEPYKLHFFKPKSGYMPVHRFGEDEAMRNRELYSNVVLALLLGQFRPSVNWEGTEQWCFEWRVNATGRAQPDEMWRSLADIIRHLRNNDELYREIGARNEGFLNDLGPAALLALDLICQYNISWVARQNFTFKKIADKLKEQGIHSTESIFEPPSPQQLVLETIRQKIADVLNTRWSVRIALSQIGTQDTEVLNTYEILNQFLHHFAKFVPTMLKTQDPNSAKKEHVVSLLALLSEVDIHSYLPAEEDLTLREPQQPGRKRNPVTGRLGLRAPWKMYTPDIGATTLMYHEELSNTSNTTMRPVERSEGRKIPPDQYRAIAERERLNDGMDWTRTMLIADGWVQEPKLYPHLLRMKSLIGTDMAAWQPWMKRRKELARAPMLRPPTDGTVRRMGDSQEFKAPVFDAPPAAAEARRLPAPAKSAPNPFDRLDQVSFAGQFSNEKVHLVLEPAAGGYEGKVTVKGQTFPIKAQAHEGVLAGKFFHDGTASDFVCRMNGSVLEFSTGKTTQALKRADAAVEKKNPFDDL